MHVPGVERHTADYLSRHVTDSGDWMLPDAQFRQLQAAFHPLSRDLFAARHNARLAEYISWKPDPGAAAVDAFSLPADLWTDGYAFPPFLLVGKCLQFIRQ